MRDDLVGRLNGWGTIFRFITPILVTINLFILGQVWIQINDLNERVYHHITNADLHIPRAEFESIKNQITDMRREIIDTIRTEHKR